jgi:cell division protein FtsW
MTLFVNLALVGMMILLIYQQPNLSVSMILGFMTLMMLFIGGIPLSVYLMTLPLLGYILFHKIMDTPYQKRRIVGWLNPWADPQDAGYNLIQSYYAIGSGGLFGVGLGHSIQKLYYLPFQYTDFIFAVICEELGLIGAIIVLGLFAIVGWRGFSIAFGCPSNFGQMLAFGITGVILLQAIINISVTVGLMPVTGVTLPLISYGGTSMVITLAMIGVLLNISRYRLNTQVVDIPEA